ncbi:MAG: KTSC domain-containing protein [bacterium]|nr:KTSC domain-containing protein [bacterium]
MKKNNKQVTLGWSILILTITFLVFTGRVNTSAPPQVEYLNNQPIKNTQDHVPYYIYVKYRPSPVDIAHPRFEHLDTSNSSFIKGAWYDAENQYMVINLNGVYYHYCSFPSLVWFAFERAWKPPHSFGNFYTANIKGNYDCRVYPIPVYE